jgi:hypothetical protein
MKGPATSSMTAAHTSPCPALAGIQFARRLTGVGATALRGWSSALVTGSFFTSVQGRYRWKAWFQLVMMACLGFSTAWLIGTR